MVTITVRIRREDKERLMHDCVDKFRRDNKALEDVHIPEWKIINRLIDKYLDRWV